MVTRLFGMFRRRRSEADCEEVRSLSSDYIDGELEQSTMSRIRSHLERCGPCNAFINSLRATVSLLRNMPKHRAPGDFRQRIRETLQGRS